ncbi:hypothetical protein HOY82DRAFT_538998 [Tuber indicum]|nr:hypothetical protein HOY82DRAFT_538998 [Tuber indicum]
MAWRIPLLQQLCSTGVLVKWLTVGAGAPQIKATNNISFYVSGKARRLFYLFLHLMGILNSRRILFGNRHLEAVVDQDFGRICILQEPMGAKYSTVIIEPTKIPNGIHFGHILVLITDIYDGDRTVIPIVEYLGSKPTTPLDNIRRVDGLTVFEEGGKTSFRFPASSSPSTLPDADSWLRQQIPEQPKEAYLRSCASLDGQNYQSRDPSKTWTINTVEGNNHSSGCYIRTVGIRISEEKVILIGLIEERTTLGEPVPLPHSFRYHPETGLESICQVTWEATTDFVHTLWNKIEAFVKRPGNTVYAPTDFATALGWKVIIDPKAIFLKEIDHDLLYLVYLPIAFVCFLACNL